MKNLLKLSLGSFLFLVSCESSLEVRPDRPTPNSSDKQVSIDCLLYQTRGGQSSLFDVESEKDHQSKDKLANAAISCNEDPLAFYTVRCNTNKIKIAPVGLRQKIIVRDVTTQKTHQAYVGSIEPSRKSIRLQMCCEESETEACKEAWDSEYGFVL